MLGRDSGGEPTFPVVIVVNPVHTGMVMIHIEQVMCNLVSEEDEVQNVKEPVNCRRAPIRLSASTLGRYWRVRVKLRIYGNGSRHGLKLSAYTTHHYTSRRVVISYLRNSISIPTPSLRLAQRYRDGRRIIATETQQQREAGAARRGSSRKGRTGAHSYTTL